MRQQMEQAMEDVQMEDVSINLEDGMNSADDLNLPADHPMKNQNQNYGQEDDSFDKRDPLEMAQEALMGQGADEADQEIEQIINKKQGWHDQSDEDELDEEQYAQYQQQLAGSQEQLVDQEEEEEEVEGDDEVIHPDLIAAAQEMGLELNPD